MLKYATEQLIHFLCNCGEHWTRSGNLPDFVRCPKCGKSFEQFEQITNRPLIEAFTLSELIAELDKRGYQVNEPEKTENLLERFAQLKMQVDEIKTNAISPDAGMPQRGVK